MSRLSDVLGGVYRDDDPTPNQHDSAALDVAPDVDDEVSEAPAWELDDAVPAEDDEPVAESGDPTDNAPVWDLQSVVDDPNTEWEPEEVVEIASDWAEPAQLVDDHGPAPVDSTWLEDLGDATPAPEAPAWDLESFDETDVEAELVDAGEPPTDEQPEPAPVATAAPDDTDSRTEQSITAASFGLLSAEEAPEGDLDITDTGPWLRSDDDILPARAKRGLAFWRR
jgi:hypothetical protein